MKRSTQRLTKTLVASLQPAAKEYHVWDRDDVGFAVRVYPSGSKNFIAQRRDQRGRLRKKKIGPFGILTVDQARESAKHFLSSLIVGIPQSAPRSSVLFETLMVEWLTHSAVRHRKTHVRRKKNAIENDERNLTIHALPVLRGKMADEITKADIEAVRDRAEKKRPHPAGVRRKGRGFRGPLGGLYAAARTIRTLSSVFAYGEDRGWVVKNPTKGVRVEPDRKREVFLTDGEVRSVRDVLDEARRAGENPKSLDIIVLFNLTGCRRSEIEKLQWNEVDLERRILRLPDTKTGHQDKYLSALAAEIIARQARVPGNPYVFPGDVKHVTYHQNAKKVWQKLRKENWPHVRIHDLRHTFASQLASKGADLQTIRDLLGHANIRSTERYAHLASHHLHSAVSKVEGPFQ